MVGRGSFSHVFDRGKRFFAPLWPPLLQVVFAFWPLWIVLLLLIWNVIVKPTLSWLDHLRLASLISEWHRGELSVLMKRKGIKPRRSPLPPPLGALPCNLMVLSSVMILMSRVGPVRPPSQPPVTFVEAAGEVRSLMGLLPMGLHRPPPKPNPPTLSRHGQVSAADGEGNEVNECTCGCVVNHLQCLSPDELSELLSTDFICNPCDSSLLDHASGSLDDHVALSWWDCLSCCLSRLPTSFGSMGLLAGDGADTSAIVDTGASMAVTPFREDFTTFTEVQGRVLKGLTKGTAVKGTGIVNWKTEVGGKVVELKLRALFVPESDVRLLSPQQLRQEHPAEITLMDIRKDCVRIKFPEGVLDCPLNESNLPVMTVCSPADSAANLKALNACVMAEMNQNLFPSQKELLKWHSKLGHIDLKQVQRIMKSGALGWTPLVKAAANLDLNKNPLLCGSCAFAKAKRKASLAKRSKTDKKPPSEEQSKEKLLSKDVLIPGEKISMDHFIVSTPGRLFSSRGSESADRLYKGGVIFKDHASGFVFVEPVVNFTAGEAIRAKQRFEREMASMGVTVLSFHTDNGVFTSAAFQDELSKLGQGLSLSGVGAHHQNAMAERSIGVVFSLARTMMLHAKLRWPKAVSPKLWPMVVKHAEFIVNHVPGANNVCPMDLILKTAVPRDHLRNLHVWGAPAFVLDPKLQDGKKIPKWEPRSRQGMHLGWSPLHASNVPLILNLHTGHVSPQFHVVFDDWFSTVSSEDKGIDDIDDEVWSQLFMDHRFLAHFDDDDPMDLDDEWLTELERLEKHQKAAARVRSNAPSLLVKPLVDDAPVSPSDRHHSPMAPTHAAPTNAPATNVAPTNAVPVGSQSPNNAPASNVGPPLAAHPRQQREPPASFKPKKKTTFVIDQVDLNPTPRKRPAPGKFKGMCAAMIALLGNDLLVKMASAVESNPAAHMGLLGFNAVTETFDDVEWFSFMAVTAPRFKKKKGEDPDFPTHSQTLLRPDADEWLESMKEEIKTLIEMNTWTVVPRAEAVRLGKKVIKSTWAFRQKRDPSSNPTRKKSRFCVRGDLQSKFEEFESCSPVVQWSTVRLMLILSIVHGLETRQVDHVNAFAQADLDRDVFIEIPQGFEHANDGVDCVLKLNKSLYGMSDAPLMFFELLKKNLLNTGFKQMKHIDPCLFVHRRAICLTYVDDCLWFGKDGAALDKLIEEMKGKMDLKVESRDVSAFLGIQFTRRGDTIELTQHGLIDKIIAATGLQDANGKPTPADAKTLGKDKNGAPFSEEWNYPSVVGMLLYLSGNSRPDIAFAVNQAARFTHDPKDSHAVAVKRIVRHLIATRERGLTFKPSTDWKLDCFVDADFCGLWGSEDPDDPIVSKSRTGFIITLAGCPLIWKSTLQQETSVSTMMAECVALSSAMRELLPLKRLVKTIAKIVTGDDNIVVTTKSDVFEDNNGALTVATLPRITPQSKFFAVKLHFFREHVKTDDNPNGEVEIHKIETNNQLADIMTKGLVLDKFAPLRDRLMGWDLATSQPPTDVHPRGSVGDV